MGKALGLDEPPLRDLNETCHPDLQQLLTQREINKEKLKDEKIEEIEVTWSVVDEVLKLRKDNKMLEADVKNCNQQISELQGCGREQQIIVRKLDSKVMELEAKIKELEQELENEIN